MKKMALFVMMMLPLPLMAAAPPEVSIWTAADLKAQERKLAQKLNEQKGAFEQLASFGNHLTMLARREATAPRRSTRRRWTSSSCRAGRRLLVYGGELPGAKTTAPGELRGPAVKGGERKTLNPGDVVHIPAKVPHQLLVPAGKEFTYFVIKVDTP
jgi:hypothetical protein